MGISKHRSQRQLCTSTSDNDRWLERKVTAAALNWWVLLMEVVKQLTSASMSSAHQRVQSGVRR